MSSTPINTNAEGRRRGGLASWVTYLPLVAALAMRLVSETTADLSYLVIAGYALFGRAHAIRAIIASWLFTMINPGVAPDPALDAVGRYAVLFAAALSAYMQSHLTGVRRGMVPLVLLTLLLGLFIVAHAVLFSAIPDVSVLKAISWTMAMVTCLSAWSGMSPPQQRELTDQFFWALVVLMVASLPLLQSSAGFRRNGTGFQGLLNHPQASGATMALLFAWATARLLAETRPPWVLIGVAGLSLVSVFLSEARTGGVAAILGVGFALLFGPSSAGRSMLSMAPGLRSPRVWALALLVVVGALMMSGAIFDYVQFYITKSGRAGASNLWDAFEISRGRQMDAMLANVSDSLWTGIGFGIHSEPELMVVSRDPAFGLPLGAAIEKGVAPLMVLEELGLFGAGLVLVWILLLVRGAARGGLAPFAVATTVVFINFGEATLFSPGGFGLLTIVLLGWAYSAGLVRTGPQYG